MEIFMTKSIEEQAREYVESKICFNGLEYSVGGNTYNECFRSFLVGAKARDAEIQQLKSKLAKAKTSLNNALNYLHWREDDLIGDDFKGDGKLTAEYKNKVSEIEKSISEIGGG